MPLRCAAVVLMHPPLADPAPALGVGVQLHGSSGVGRRRMGKKS